MKRIEYFLGLGQGKWSEQWLTDKLGDVITFHAAPDYFRAKTSDKIDQVGLEYITTELSAKTRDYALMAESQAVPMVLKALSESKIPIPKVLVLLQPLGLNASSLGDSMVERYESIMNRSKNFWKHPNQSLRIAGNRRTASEIAKDALVNPHKIKSFYTAGANQDYATELEFIANITTVHIFASTDDSLFAYGEIKQHFNKKNVQLHRLPGTHLNRATPKGLAQLKQILKMIQ